MSTEIRIPFEYVSLPDGRVHMLLSEAARKDMADARDKARAEGSTDLADVYTGMMDTDEKLRKQDNCTHRVAVFRQPSYMDVSEILSRSRRYDPDANDHVILPERELPTRVSYLLDRVEEDGKAIGGMDAIPVQCVASIGQQLAPWLYVSSDVRDFLSPAATT